MQNQHGSYVSSHILNKYTQAHTHKGERREYLQSLSVRSLIHIVAGCRPSSPPVDLVIFAGFYATLEQRVRSSNTQLWTDGQTQSACFPTSLPLKQSNGAAKSQSNVRTRTSAPHWWYADVSLALLSRRNSHKKHLNLQLINDRTQ